MTIISIVTTSKKSAVDAPYNGFPVHHWSLQVIGISNEGKALDPSALIESVTFELHSSFDQASRVLEKAPFHVQETGWGEFRIPTTIKFRNGVEFEVTHELSFEPSRYDSNHTIEGIEDWPLDTPIINTIDLTVPGEEVQPKDQYSYQYLREVSVKLDKCSSKVIKSVYEMMLEEKMPLVEQETKGKYKEFEFDLMKLDKLQIDMIEEKTSE